MKKILLSIFLLIVGLQVTQAKRWNQNGSKNFYTDSNRFEQPILIGVEGDSAWITGSHIEVNGGDTVFVLETSFGEFQSGREPGTGTGNGEYLINADGDTMSFDCIDVNCDSIYITVHGNSWQLGGVLSGAPTETDPVYSASVASGINGTDTANWNAKSEFDGDYNNLSNLPNIGDSVPVYETDPVYSAWDKSTGISITESQISDLGTYLESESDPVYSASVASGITGSDTANWNQNETFKGTGKNTKIAIWQSTDSLSHDAYLKFTDSILSVTNTLKVVSNDFEFLDSIDATPATQNEGYWNEIVFRDSIIFVSESDVGIYSLLFKNDTLANLYSYNPGLYNSYFAANDTILFISYPDSIASFTVDITGDLVWVSSYTYSSIGAGFPYLYDSFLYLATESGVRSFSFDESGTLSYINTYSGGGNNIFKTIYYDGTYMYAGRSDNGYSIFSVASGVLSLEYSYTTTPHYYFDKIVVDDNYVYVAGSYIGLCVFSKYDGGALTLLAQFNNGSHTGSGLYQNEDYVFTNGSYGIKKYKKTNNSQILHEIGGVYVGGETYFSSYLYNDYMLASRYELKVFKIEDIKFRVTPQGTEIYNNLSFKNLPQTGTYNLVLKDGIADTSNTSSGVETDPIYSASVASGITGSDTAAWNAASAGTVSGTESVFDAWDKNAADDFSGDYNDLTNQPSFPDSVAPYETDPIYSAWDKSTGISITESQISDLQSYLTTESDPVFGASLASGISASDTNRWINSLKGIYAPDTVLNHADDSVLYQITYYIDSINDVFYYAFTPMPVDTSTSGSSGVSSFNGRTGAVTPTINDYDITQIQNYDVEISNNANVTQNSSFYTTPSSRITAGTGIDWSGNTLNVTVTGGTSTVGGSVDTTLAGNDTLVSLKKFTYFDTYELAKAMDTIFIDTTNHHAYGVENIEVYTTTTDSFRFVSQLPIRYKNQLADTFHNVPYLYHEYEIRFFRRFVSIELLDTILADLVAPVLDSAVVYDENPDSLVLFFSEAVNITTTGWDLDSLGGSPTITINSVGNSGTDHPYFLLADSIGGAGDYVLSYTPGATTDLNGNALASLTDSTVTNHVVISGGGGIAYNLILWSEDLTNALWVDYLGITVTANQANDLLGNTTLEELAMGFPESGLYQNVNAVCTASNTYTFSFEAAHTDGGDPNLLFWVEDDNNVHYQNTYGDDLTATVTRYYFQFTVDATIQGNLLLNIEHQLTGSPNTIVVGRAWLTPGTIADQTGGTYTYVTTTTTPVTP